MDHAQTVEAVKASLLLPANPADRHNIYRLRAVQERAASTDLYPVNGRRVVGVTQQPPEPPSAA